MAAEAVVVLLISNENLLFDMLSSVLCVGSGYVVVLVSMSAGGSQHPLRSAASEVAVDVHTLMEDAHDIDNTLGGDPVVEGV